MMLFSLNWDFKHEYCITYYTSNNNLTYLILWLEMLMIHINPSFADCAKEEENWTRINIDINYVWAAVDWVRKNITGKSSLYLGHVRFKDPQDATYFQLAMP